MRTLYFEGAGCVPRGDVPNCRIRTAFHTDDGRALYLEVLGNEVTRNTAPIYQNYTNVGHLDHCHYIVGVSDEGHQHHKLERGHTFEYTMKNLLRLVHDLGASFDAVEVLPDLAGYRVHKDGGGYNYGDEFPYDAELTAKREAIRAEIFAMEKAELEEDRQTGAKKFVHSPGRMDYPNFSLWVDHDDPKLLHLLRHFNGFNKHWTIDASAEDWRATMTEAKLGRYGC